MRSVPILLSVISIGYYTKMINLKMIFLGLMIFYWLPKCLFLTYTTEKFYPQILTRNTNTTNKISLTFDDLPYGYHTELIDTLNKHNIKATFFVIKDFVTEENKQTLIEAIKNGHQICNHGKTDSAHWLLSKEDLINEITTCDLLIKELYNSANTPLPQTMLYRPGCGIWTNQMVKIVNDLNYTIAMGSIHPHDPLFRNAWLNYWYLRLHIENGDIIILHDRKWTAPMLDMFLPFLKENNYNAVTLNELFIK